MRMFLVFFVFQVVFTSHQIKYNELCTYGETVDGEIFLDGFHNNYYQADFTNCVNDDEINGDPYLVFTIGEVFFNQDYTCDNPETPSPTPGIYTDENGACYWVGSLQDCSMSEYDTKTQSFELTYPGYLSAEKVQTRRSLRYHMTCDKNAKEPEINCISISQVSSEIWYDVAVKSSLVCPVGPGSEKSRHAEFVTALVFFILFGIGWFIFLGCLTTGFVVFLLLVLGIGVARRRLYKKL